MAAGSALVRNMQREFNRDIQASKADNGVEVEIWSVGMFHFKDGKCMVTSPDARSKGIAGKRKGDCQGKGRGRGGGGLK